MNVTYLSHAVVLPLLLACAFVMGKYHERVAWNKLIAKGVLPKPNRG